MCGTWDTAFKMIVSCEVGLKVCPDSGGQRWVRSDTPRADRAPVQNYSGGRCLQGAMAGGPVRSVERVEGRAPFSGAERKGQSCSLEGRIEYFFLDMSPSLIVRWPLPVARYNMPRRCGRIRPGEVRKGCWEGFREKAATCPLLVAVESSGTVLASNLVKLIKNPRF